MYAIALVKLSMEFGSPGLPLFFFLLVEVLRVSSPCVFFGRLSLINVFSAEGSRSLFFLLFVFGDPLILEFIRRKADRCKLHLFFCFNPHVSKTIYLRYL